MTTWTAVEEARSGGVDVVQYLRATGWNVVGEGERVTSWERTVQNEPLRIVVPAKRDGEDFALRMAEAIAVIAYAERRTFGEALADVEAGGADVVSVRINASTPTGLAPLSVAEKAVTALRKLVVGSAAGITVQGAVLPNRKKRAERYAGRARLATSAGSFVLTAVMPLYEARIADDQTPGQVPLDETLEIPATPFGRQVAERMRTVAHAAVSLAADVVAGRDDVTAFDENASATGNSTELEALAGLGGGLPRDYQVRFTSSPVVAGGLDDPEILTVGVQEQRVLEEAAGLLRERKPKAETTVVGFVVRLARDDTEWGPGDVWIKGLEAGAGREHRYRVYLSEDQLHEATIAFDRRLLVSAQGRLRVRGTSLSLEDLRAFTVQQELPQAPQG